MLDLIIFIKSDGDNALPKSLVETVNSIENTIGSVNYKYYFVLNARQEKTIHDMIRNHELGGSKILKIKRSLASWAYEYNLFLDSCKDITKYILISHDDSAIRTDDWFNKTVEFIKGKEDEIGWITYTSDFYYKYQLRPIPVTARCGLAKDRAKFPYIYECHNFNSSHRGANLAKNIHLLDMPESNKLVKIHAPMSSLFMASAESAKKIGYCEDWAPYTVLIDEDWGFEALRNNLWNIWIPNIFYTHPLNNSKRRAGNRWTTAAHRGFIKKWQFDITKGAPTKEQMKEIQEQYKDTLIPWSSYYFSYEWQYL